MARPAWLRAPAPVGDNYRELKQLVTDLKLHTVCESAACPNVGECWNRRTATFMILGNVCTRRCGFCAVQKGAPLETDYDEPRRVAEACATLGLRYAVITSVNRDDRKDGGAELFAMTIRAIRERIPGSSQSVGQGVAVEVGERQAAIDLDLVTEYGLSIVDLSRAVRRNVIEAVEGMTGLEVTEVNVLVNDIHLPTDDAQQEGRERRVE